MGEDVTRGLPADLASVLRDQSIVVPQDAAVFELVAAWAKAPSATASAEIPAQPASESAAFRSWSTLPQPEPRRCDYCGALSPAGCMNAPCSYNA